MPMYLFLYCIFRYILLSIAYSQIYIWTFLLAYGIIFVFDTITKERSHLWNKTHTHLATVM